MPSEWSSRRNRSIVVNFVLIGVCWSLWSLSILQPTFRFHSIIFLHSEKLKASFLMYFTKYYIWPQRFELVLFEFLWLCIIWCEVSYNNPSKKSKIQIITNFYSLAQVGGGTENLWRDKLSPVKITKSAQISNCFLKNILPKYRICQCSDDSIRGWFIFMKSHIFHCNYSFSKKLKHE